MKMNVLAAAAELSDQDLLARLQLLAARERGASVELVAHLAALDTRPSVFAAKGYSSVFNYCVEALKLSEDAACNRIAAARACRQRDGDRCAFVSKDGRRCTERTFLEFHHEDPYALGCPPTADFVSLRCWRHNQYEAELFFGPHSASKGGGNREPFEGLRTPPPMHPD